eukprot:14996436-Alexandrium_andersonii.AAC.1
MFEDGWAHTFGPTKQFKATPRRREHNNRCGCPCDCVEVRGSARKCAEVRGSARKCAEVRRSARKCAE